MPRLNYVGPEPSIGIELINRGQGTDIINNAIPNRSATTAAVEATANTYASKDYIDLADGNYTTVDYYQNKIGLNVYANQVGQPNGVASLVGGKIPIAQVPVLGSGYLKGPFGPTTTATSPTAGTTPVKVADFTIGVQSVAFQPLAYATVAVDTKPGGRPILEMRLSNGTANYGSQTLIAQGIGRPIYDGRQIVCVTPASDTTNAQSPSSWPGNTNIIVSLWAYSSSSVPITISSSAVLSAVVFLLRTTA